MKPLPAWRPGPATAPLLLGLLAGLVVLGIAVDPADTPLNGLMLPLLLGTLVLGPRYLPRFLAWTFLLLVAAVLLQPHLTARIWTAAAVQVAMIAVVAVVAVRRDRLGVGSLAGEAMFVDLRDRLLDQGRMPRLPEGWHVEGALRSAGGTPFAGDFMVSTRTPDGRLEVVLVDVSGKGEAAGARALMLSGAFGGLLGALPPERFLPAANDYLLRQQWDEGFASAVHLSLDLATGVAEVRTAGHPPAVHRHAGSGRWSVLDEGGGVLGIIDDLEVPVVRFELRPGDAVLLYTDGMVEDPRRDIDLGIDRLLGFAERVLPGGVVGTATRLVTELGSRSDDRAVVLLSRF